MQFFNGIRGGKIKDSKIMILKTLLCKYVCVHVCTCLHLCMCVYVFMFIFIQIIFSTKSHQEKLCKLSGSKVNKNVNGIWVIKLIKVIVSNRILEGNLNWLIQSHTQIPMVLRLSSYINKKNLSEI